MQPPIAGYTRSKAFERDYKKLDAELQKAVDQAILDLLKSPMPAGRRFEKLKGYKNPNIYTVHVTANHAYKMSLEIRANNIAHLRRIATHREIDRSP